MNKEKIVVSVQDLINCLDNGLDRDDIAVKFGITKAEVKDLFQHPKLKGRKVKTARKTILIDEDETSKEEAIQNLKEEGFLTIKVVELNLPKADEKEEVKSEEETTREAKEPVVEEESKEIVNSAGMPVQGSVGIPTNEPVEAEEFNPSDVWK